MKITQPSDGALTLGTTVSGDATGTLPGDISIEKVNGLPPSWKNPVRAATTAAITLFTDLQPGDTIDGITLVDQDRVLVKNQSSAEENGIYIVGSSIRSPDMDESDEVVGAAVYVAAGTTNASTIWINTNTTPPVIDTDAITFAQFNTASGSLGSITDGITTVAPVTSLTVEPHSLAGTTPSASHALNRPVTVADAGAAYEFDLANGNEFDLTLTQNCVFTIAAGAVAGYFEKISIVIRQGGVGSFTVTWPAEVIWQNEADGTATGSAPTLWTAPGASDLVILDSRNGGTDWGAFLSPHGGGAAAIEILDDGVSLTGTPSSMDFVGAGVTATAVGDDVTVTIPGITEAAVRDIGRWEYVFMDGEIVLDGDDGLMMWVGG